ncbi:hypothetical protein NQT69_05475 [Pseudoalteromonas shioyasakiensis]|uniref:hypothetical protein n=1 Tax=Pseudoalteromonas shioyasakiensis TaxID=1190813 RepID=UPI00211790EC|nr:hypothetical protein [Pseudoalteromonas shioyasakiensis]MCQ8877482.1 hypothetical protein [Pseudoalteromonas shioyasakiensis]
MLAKFKNMQKDKLEQMLAKQSQLQQRSLQEQQRLQRLQQHIDSMDKNINMQSSLGLQNLSGMKAILANLSHQQTELISQSKNDEHRQQRACLKQMSFTKGIEGIVNNRHISLQRQQQTQENKQLDEMVSQAYIRQKMSD